MHPNLINVLIVDFSVALQKKNLCFS